MNKIVVHYRLLSKFMAQPLEPFLYNETRTCSRFFLLVKACGFTFYTTGAIMCLIQDSHIIHNITFITYFLSTLGMFASLCNTARYEYAFYQIYGKVFTSIQEYNAWKLLQMPGLKNVFEVIEIILKAGFLLTSSPFKFEINDPENKVSICEFTIIFFKVHIIIVLGIYLICFFFLICIYSSFKVTSFLYTAVQTVQNEIITYIPTVSPNSVVFYFFDKESTCCICMDKTSEPWVMTPCAHSFHRTCLSIWNETQTTPSCPICRRNIP